MKRLIALGLVLTLLGPGFCLAADQKAEEPVSLSLSNLKEIWVRHSPDYAKLSGDLSLSSSNVRDLLNSMDRADASNNGTLLNSLLNSHDQAKLAYDVALMQKPAKIENAVLSAQQSFLLCLQDQLNLNTATEKLLQKQAQLSKNANGVQSGYLSQKAYLDLKNSVDELQNNLTALRNKRNSDETALKAKLGLPLDAALAYTTPAFGAEFFAPLMNIDPTADLAAMQKNSVSLQVLELTRDRLQQYRRSYATSNQVASAQLNLDNAKAVLPASYTAQYQRLTSQYQDLQNEYRKLSIEQDKLSKLEKQYEKGLLSSLTLDNAKLSFSSLQNSVKAKECSFYDLYLTYANMVAGN